MAGSTPIKGFALPVIGGDVQQWGIEVNVNAAQMDRIMGGLNVLDATGSAGLTMTGTGAQCFMQRLTGTLTQNINLTVPAIGAFYAIKNDTTGPYTIRVVASISDPGVFVEQGLGKWIFTDGAHVYPCQPTGWQVLKTYFLSISGTPVTVIPLPVAFYRRFRMTFQNIIMPAGAFLAARFSRDGGATFAQTGYTQAALEYFSSSKASGENINIPQLTVCTNAFSTARPSDSVCEVNPISANGFATMVSKQFGYSQARNTFTGDIAGGVLATAGSVVNAVQIYPSSGVLTGGSLTLEGLP